MQAGLDTAGEVFGSPPLRLESRTGPVTGSLYRSRASSLSCSSTGCFSPACFSADTDQESFVYSPQASNPSICGQARCCRPGRFQLARIVPLTPIGRTIFTVPACSHPPVGFPLRSGVLPVLGTS